MRLRAPDTRAIRRQGGSLPLHTFVLFFLTVLTIVTVFPVYNAILVSVTPFRNQSTNYLLLYPRGIDLSAYTVALEKAGVAHSLLVSVTITVLGVIYNLFLSVTMAYALSRKGFWGRSFFLYLVVITMFFSGGIIPYYLTIRGLGLKDSIFTLIIPTGINAFYMLLLRNYMNSIPVSLEESAKMDGANDITILARIFVPLAKPILATVALFYMVDRWNDYFLAILFIRSASKMPIQQVLRDVVVNMNTLSFQAQQTAAMRAVYSESLKMAIVVISVLPIMLIYPFLQKYFTKGIMLGSIKA